MSGNFVSLHNHTELGSPLDGMNDVKDLFVRAKEVGHPGVAVTDHGTMTAIYDAWKASQETGVKLIPGMEAYFTDDETEKKSYHLVLLAQNEVGYRNILKLNYMAFQNQVSGFMGKKTPRISWRHIEQANEGVIALTACSNGLVGKTLITNQEVALAEQHMKRFHSIFKDRFFLELQPHALQATQKDGKEVNQVKLNEAMLKYSHDYGIPYVITCDAHYRDKEHAKYHDFMLAIKDKKAVDDPDRFRYGVQDMYLKTDEEIVSFFGRRVAETGMANTMRILNLCEDPSYVKPKGPVLPSYPVHQESDYNEFSEWKNKTKSTSSMAEDKAYLRFKCIEGFRKKLAHLDKEKKEEYWERVKLELGVLEDKNFSSYMLIVADYINWAKQKMPVGPARGSAAGSLVAYLSGITEVDPIEYDLLFERFQNAQKKSFPDIDSDFSDPGLVKEYIKNKYGEDKVASISNWSTLSPKVAVKDVARSLRLGGDKSTAFTIANAITAAMPDVPSLDEAMELSDDVTKYMKKYPELYQYTKKLESLTRNWSVHAAGVVIGDRPLYEMAPLRVDEKEGKVVTQWEKTRCEDNGLIKMDILGVQTLTTIDETFKLIEETTGRRLTTADIDFSDAEVYKMIGRGETAGVFQLESSLTPLCMKIKPKDIEEISAINALGRPSCPPEQRAQYVNRKLGKEKVTYKHPTLERAQKKTFGITLYEEQMMIIAKDCAGWDLNQADALRKITKLKGKDEDLLLKTEANFIKDCMSFGDMTYEDARRIWKEEIEPFGAYGFNKSHSVSYSFISYYTAWLRYHYPTQFMCAILNSEDPNGDKIQEYIDECRKMGITLLPPDANSSSILNKVTGEKEITSGLSTVKGLGVKAVGSIVANQPYVNFIDFLARNPSRLVGKTAIQSLSKAGAFDAFGLPRRDMHDNYQKYRNKINALIRKEISIAEAEESDEVEDRLQTSEFDDASEGVEEANKVVSLKPTYDAEMTDKIKQMALSLEIKDLPEEWDKKHILLFEREVLGRAVSGSLHEAFKGFFSGGSTVTSLGSVGRLESGSKIRVEGIVKNKIKEFKIKNGANIGRKFAKYLIEDSFGNTCGMTLWADDYDKYRPILVDGIPFKAICKVNEYMDQKDLVLSTLERVYGRES